MTPRFRHTLFPLLCLLATAMACANSKTPEPAGGETHFLEGCEEGTCGVGLECVCGVCTTSCTTDETCKELSPRATCEPAVTLNGACGQLASVCDAPCSLDTDCDTLGVGYTCDSGSCRKLDAESCSLVNESPVGFNPDPSGSMCPGAVAALLVPGVEIVNADTTFTGRVLTDTGIYGAYARDPSDMQVVRIGLNDEPSRVITHTGENRPQHFATAGCRVYWRAGGTLPGPFQIWSALRGGGDERIIATAEDGIDHAIVGGVVTDSTHLYVVDNAGIYRVPLGGGTLEIVRPTSGPGWNVDMLVMPDRVLVVEDDDDDSSTLSSDLISVPKDTTAEPIVLASGFSASALATDGVDLYIGTPGTQDASENPNGDASIQRVPLSGGSPTTIVAGLPNVPGKLTIDATHIYWEMNTDDSFGIWRAPKDDPSQAAPLITNVHDAFLLGVNATHVYWIHGCEAAAAPGVILRIAKDEL